MSSKAASKKKEILAADFPALREFVRGYFHEDMNDDYGSPQGAAEQFCQDADPAQRAAVVREWERFMREAKGQPIEAINQLLADEMGSACHLRPTDLTKISAAFYRNLDSD
jgi:hypothetical protein